MGFEVLSRGRFGIVVQADAQLYRETLHVTVDENAPSLSAPVTQPDARLAGLVDYIEVLPQPQYFTEMTRKLARE